MLESLAESVSFAKRECDRVVRNLERFIINVKAKEVFYSSSEEEEHTEYASY